MGFVRKVADRVIFMDEGQIFEQNEPEAFLITALRLDKALTQSNSGASMRAIGSGLLDEVVLF